MANINVSYPPATGAVAPPTELKAFGNTSASTKDSNLNYPTGTLIPTTPVDGNIHTHEQYLKGQQEYPR